uniref:Uncharacterized protein n=1 Tax=Chrysemys picta bellii TaxID=8478 RepID=A0A8C3HVE1_CHRPI
MALHLLENWCKGMSINPRNCLLGAIEPILRASAEYLSKCKMRGRMFVREEGAFAVLCELTSAVDPLQVPGTITVEDGEWTVITTGSQPSPVPASDVEFLKKMLTAPSPDEWVKALGQALEKVMPPHPESSPYRKLRLFSGGPTPIPGEEAFETWLENTTEMLQEWVVPDAEKRRRLVECLRGPALDVIRTLKLSNPGVKVKDCLEALDHAFGRTEGSDDVYCKFLNARQQKGEKVSAYIQRLEKLLQKAIMRGAVAVEQMDLTRLAQIVRGIQYQNPILLHLRLRERQDNPPSYSRLIKEVREEEERQAAVLLQNLGISGKHKIADRWKAIPYLVMEKLGDLPVYKIKPEEGPGQTKTVHRNLLLPMGELVGTPYEMGHNRATGQNEGAGPKLPSNMDSQPPAANLPLCSTSESESEEDQEVR